MNIDTPKLQRVLNQIRSLERIDLLGAEASFIEDKVRELLIGYVTPLALVGSNQDIFRGVFVDERPQNIERIGIPPADKITKFQRANYPFNPMFYCCNTVGGVLSEMRCKAGNKLVLSKWKIGKQFHVNQVGYHEEVFKKYSTTRDKFPAFAFARNGQTNHPSYRAVEAFLASQFSLDVKDGSEWQYKVSAAIAASLMDKTDHQSMANQPGIHGLVYPSLAARANSENLALRPRIAQNHLTLIECIFLTILGISEGGEFLISHTDLSNDFKDDGSIIWQNEARLSDILKNEQRVTKKSQNTWLDREGKEIYFKI
jgi:hypothetical protein